MASKNQIANKFVVGSHFTTFEVLAAARKSGHFPANFSDDEITFMIDGEVICEMHREIERLCCELAEREDMAEIQQRAVGCYEAS